MPMYNRQACRVVSAPFIPGARVLDPTRGLHVEIEYVSTGKRATVLRELLYDPTEPGTGYLASSGKKPPTRRMW